MNWRWLLHRRASIVILPVVSLVAITVLVLGRPVASRLMRVSRAAARSVEVRSVRLQRDAADAASPPTFRVSLETTKGAIVIDVARDWAPHGADRFYRLVQAGYYDDNRFFRVVHGQWAQFGINGDPKVATAWRNRTIPDDPPNQSNLRGTVTFAFAVPDGRATQVYIALTDLSARQDAQGFVPFGRVSGGLDVANALNSEYGEAAGGGIRGGKQQPLFDGGNAYLDREFPRLDRIVRAGVVR